MLIPTNKFAGGKRQIPLTQRRPLWIYNSITIVSLHCKSQNLQNLKKRLESCKGVSFLIWED